MNDEQQEAAVTVVLQNLGAPPESALTMAKQLLKRACQIAGNEGVSEAEALQRLLEKIVEARTQ